MKTTGAVKRMGYYEKLLDLKKIRDLMLDDKSKILFDAKIDYMITRNREQFYNIIDALEKNWYCQELNEILARVDIKGIIIFGCGHDGKRTKKVLELCNYQPTYFCDSDISKVGSKVEGINVISAEELTEKYNDYLIVLGSEKYAEEMFHFLMEKRFPIEKILYSKYGMVLARRGKQYFDMFLPEDGEVFIDGGGYNGNTVSDFVEWSREEYKKVYVFEPIFDMSQVIKGRIEREKITGVELYNNALWNKKEDLLFVEAEAGSHIAEVGNSVVKGVTLDEIIKDEKVTYIKLDVEGSELKALEGTKNTIKKNKPRLAICIYHKPEDILELPLYILNLVPEYKFYIRHYCSCMWETVLYAVIPE